MTSNTKYAYIVRVSSADDIVGIFSSRKRAEQIACQYVKRICDEHGVKVEVRVYENMVHFKPASTVAASWWVDADVTRHVLE